MGGRGWKPTCSTPFSLGRLFPAMKADPPWKFCTIDGNKCWSYHLVDRKTMENLLNLPSGIANARDWTKHCCFNGQIPSAWNRHRSSLKFSIQVLAWSYWILCSLCTSMRHALSTSNHHSDRPQSPQQKTPLLCSLRELDHDGSVQGLQEQARCFTGRT